MPVQIKKAGGGRSFSRGFAEERQKQKNGAPPLGAAEFGAAGEIRTRKLSPADFKSAVYANSTTAATLLIIEYLAGEVKGDRLYSTVPALESSSAFSRSAARQRAARSSAVSLSITLFAIALTFSSSISL